jgi:hypothetical protein
MILTFQLQLHSCPLSKDLRQVPVPHMIRAKKHAIYKHYECFDNLANMQHNILVQPPGLP